MSRYVDIEGDWVDDAIKAYSLGYYEYDEYAIPIERFDSAPSIEPNRILPERMERGDIYEVGETIVVLNHDDYYDLLCKSWVPKRGEWIRTGRTNIYGGIEVQCSNCGDKVMVQHLEDEWYCRHCGADMREREGE